VDELTSPSADGEVPIQAEGRMIMTSAFKATALILSKRPTYSELTWRVVKTYVTAALRTKNKTGRKVNSVLENEIWSHLVIDEPDADGRMIIKSNITYSYAIIRMAAKAVISRPCWQSDPKVRALKLSNRWVLSFLRRKGFRRRKFTTEVKKRPSDEDINAVLKKGTLIIIYSILCRMVIHCVGQDLIVQNNYQTYQIANLDETGVKYECWPTHMYGPLDINRELPSLLL
jgi:hypothetical protein